MVGDPSDKDCSLGNHCLVDVQLLGLLDEEGMEDVKVIRCDPAATYGHIMMAGNVLFGQVNHTTIGTNRFHSCRQDGTAR